MKKERMIIALLLLIALAIVIARTAISLSGEGKSSGNSQYDSIEAAMQNADIAVKSGDEYRKTITQEIFRLERRDYVTVYFLSQKNEKEAFLTLAQFKIINGEKKQYQFLSCIPERVRADSTGDKDGISRVKSDVQFLNLMKSMGPDSDKTFLYGQNGDAAIENLKIDGQSPDGVIPFTVLGEQRYFWYYEDLATDNAVEEMVITMDE